MTGRLQATLDAVKIVQPALDKFYNSLSDEQKERFNQLGPKQQANNPESTAALPQDNKSCSEAKPGLATLPIEKIRRRRQADRRAAGRLQATAGRDRQSGRDPASGLPGRHAAHPARPAGRDGDAPAGDGRRGANRQARA